MISQILIPHAIYPQYSNHISDKMYNNLYHYRCSMVFFHINSFRMLWIETDYNFHLCECRPNQRLCLICVFLSANKEISSSIPQIPFSGKKSLRTDGYLYLYNLQALDAPICLFHLRSNTSNEFEKHYLHS